MNIKKTGVICAALIGLTGNGQAALIVEEGFNYPAGVLNGTQNSGLGFAAGSNWGTSGDTIVTGLTRANLAIAGTGAIKSGGSNPSRSLAAAFGGSTFYISMLVNANSTNTVRMGFELRQSGGDGPLFGRVTNGWGIFTGDQGDLGISNTGGAFQTWTGVAQAPDAATHLIVYKVDYEANAIKLYVDPVPGATEPAPSATFVTGGAWTVNLNGNTWNGIRLTHAIYNQTADELRIGTTWADVTYAGPVSITSGGTYSGNWKSLNPDVAAVTLATTAAVTIQNSNITGKGNLIACPNTMVGYNLTVNNTNGYGLNPNVNGRIKGSFIGGALMANLQVEHCLIQDVAFGVNCNQYSGNYNGTQTAKIRYNRFVNVDARYSDGNGGYQTTGHAGGHDIIFNNWHSVPGMEISWNEFVKTPFIGTGEDVINIYESAGTAASHMLIHDNYIKGAYPTNPLTESYSGGGILACDGGPAVNGVWADAGFVEVYNNQVIGTTNYGIATDYGHDNLFHDNRAISCGQMADGQWIHGQNVGALIWNYRTAPVTSYFNNHLHNNLVGWVKPPDANHTTWYRNDAWYPDQAENDYLLTSWWPSNGPTLADENNEFNLWLEKLATTSYTIGAASLPSPWQTAGIGSMATTGSASAASGVFTVTGSGTDLWGASDDCQYVYQSLRGDCTIVAQVTSLQNTNPLALAGVMMRETAWTGSIYAGVFVTPGSQGVLFQWRTSTGGATTSAQVLNTPAPRWVKLTRTGNSFQAYYSSNGTSWTQVGTTQTVVMANNATMGLAVNSHNDGTPCKATFSNVATTFPWISQGIGNPGLAGSATYNGGAFTLQGSGADIWNTSDQFHYVYQASAGDCAMVADVTSVQLTNPWAKSGVMIRESTAPNAIYAAMFATPGGNGVTFQWRTSTGGTTLNTAVSNMPAPRWVKLARTGNSFSAYYSSNGVNWTQVGTAQTVTMASNATMGLAVTSHNNTVLCTSTINSVTATP